MMRHLCVVVDADGLAVRQQCAVARVVWNPVSAVNRIDHDTPADGLSTGLVVIDGSLRERLVAGDEDQLQVVRRIAPRQFAHGRLDDLPTMLAPAADRDGEQRLGDLVQVVRQLVQPLGRGIAVDVQSYLQTRLLAILSGTGQLVDDSPQLALGLLNQAAHRTRIVQQDRQLDQRRIALGGGRKRHRRPARPVGVEPGLLLGDNRPPGDERKDYGGDQISRHAWDSLLLSCSSPGRPDRPPSTESHRAS